MNMSPIRPRLENDKRYKAKVRSALPMLDGDEETIVYSAVIPGICSYSFPHWFDKDRNDWGQIDLVSPFTEVYDIEEMPPDEAAEVDKMFGLDE